MFVISCSIPFGPTCQLRTRCAAVSSFETWVETLAQAFAETLAGLVDGTDRLDRLIEGSPYATRRSVPCRTSSLAAAMALYAAHSGPENSGNGVALETRSPST